MGRKLTEKQRKKIQEKRNKSRMMTIRIVAILIGILILFLVSKLLFSKLFVKSNSVETKQETVSDTNRETKKETKLETNLETTKEYFKDTEEEDISVDVVNDGEENLEAGKIINKYADMKISKEELNKRIAELPESLKKKIELYPESQSTVIQYKDAEKNNISKDISKDLENSKSYNRNVKLPYFNQWDERWGYEKVDDEYIAISGCGPTSLSMVYTGFTGDVNKNPYEMAKFAFENGWYDKQGGKYELFTSGIKELGLKSQEIKSNAESIKENLDEGNIIVALVEPNEYKDFSQTGGHYIILTEYNEEDELIIYDVNSYENTNKTWGFDRVLAQTKVLYAISK